ncbi:Response regulator receiver domain-containing protein [Pseudobutyrivibrio sp. YE44]|uniref:response regulator n=1 Tax=Pseudobutyrivibrio sp. YE44 TaxID=1520802 RepID=UPI000892496C|nr:response regulator [Pseudobutyrivibrio sp. YE44]SDB25243.1 Response regulator receiver domain-containing protein [Pseudobutyrivibrio sp. YE44]
MAKKILIISNGSTFMVEAIEKNLIGVGFEVVKSEPKIKDLKEKLDDAEIVLVYLGDYVEDAKEAFVYLKDICIEQDKSLNIIGDATEVADLNRVAPQGTIDNIFSRPLDVKMLAEAMVEVGMNSDENSKKYSILLVDDDPTYLKLVKVWLSKKYRVTIVNSGMQAITYIAKNTPDLIMLDYEMPVTSGPQVLEMIRSETATANIPVIFLTGKGDKESVTKVLDLKPQGYILKTAGKIKLMSQIDGFFENLSNKQ